MPIAPDGPAGGAVHTAPQRTYFLGNATTDEVKQYLERDDRLIVPVGSCEQHGSHLPLRTDTVQTEKLARDCSYVLKIMYAPAVEYGITPASDRGFHGTSSLKEETLTAFVKDTLSLWAGQGFKRFFLVSCHGADEHLDALEKAEGEDIYVRTLCPYYLADISGILEKQKAVMHAGEAETSVMMYIEPRLVMIDRAVDFDKTEKEKSDDPPGGIGYPRSASAEKGKALYAAMLKALTAEILKERAT